MTRTEATRLGSALVAAGVLTDAAPGAHEGKGQRRTHGTATVRGHWASGRRAIIGCEHVAAALVATGGWTEAAIRACHHVPGAVMATPAQTVKRAPARRHLAACPHCGAALEEAA